MGKKTIDPSNCAASPFTSERDDPQTAKMRGVFGKRDKKSAGTILPPIIYLEAIFKTPLVIFFNKLVTE